MQNEKKKKKTKIKIKRKREENNNDRKRQSEPVNAHSDQPCVKDMTNSERMLNKKSKRIFFSK